MERGRDTCSGPDSMRTCHSPCTAVEQSDRGNRSPLPCGRGLASATVIQIARTWLSERSHLISHLISRAGKAG
jgi:hypothetical protein